MDVERATEQVGEPQHVVDLVGIIDRRSQRSHLRGRALRLFRRDLGVGIGHGKNHRVVAHRADHIRRHRPLGRHAEEDIGTHHRLFQRAQVGLDRMGRFPLVHALGATLPEHALGVADDAVLVPCAHRLEQFDTSDPGRPCPVQDDPALLDPLARDVKRVDQPRGADHGGAVLVVVKKRGYRILP